MGLSKKEIKIVSWLELEGKRFFSRKDIKKFFRNDNEMNVYINRLKNKKRIIKLNKSKYYLIPIQAHKNKWSEHPYIVVDEIFNIIKKHLNNIFNDEYYILLPLSNNKIGIVLCLLRSNKKKVYILELLEDIQEEISKKTKCNIAIGIGKSYGDDII